jgi:hypothetical protein
MLSARRVLVLLVALTTTFPANLLAETKQQVSCGLVEQGVYLPATDGFGRTVFIGVEYIYSCETNTTDQNVCARWQNNREDGNLSKVPFEEQYETLDHSDSMGGALTLTQNLNNLDKLFTGVQGYCIDGLETDFSWLEDPYFWANMAMSAANAYFGGEASAASEAAGEASEAAEAAARALENAENAKTAEEWAAAKKVWENANKALDAAEYAKQIATLATCYAESGLDIIKGIDDYYSNDELGCNPVDEICEDETAGDAESIETFQKSAFGEFKTQLALALGIIKPGDVIEEWRYAEIDAEVEKYFVVIKDDGYIMTVQYRIPAASSDLDPDDLTAQMDKIRKAKAAVSIAAGAAKAYACYKTDGGSGSSSSSSASGATYGSVKDIAGSIANTAAGYLPFPYNSIAQGLLKFAGSFSSIHTCTSATDAKEKGSRHEKTQIGLKHGLCYKKDESCGWELAGKCQLDKYYYCCYDNPITKAMMVQIKAQLGKNWANCADLSLKELKSLKFRQCTAEEMSRGHDGTSYKRDNKESFQFVANKNGNPCMDLTEFRSVIQDMVGTISDKDFTDAIEDFMETLQPE